MNNIRLIALTVTVAVISGCATPFRAPPEFRHINLERSDSPVIVVEKIWLERKRGPLVVTGYVVKRLRATDTTRTHLDVTLYDEAGHLLRSTIERFEPQQINHRWRRPDFATYRVLLDPIPDGTARIKVSAHEGQHSH